MNEDQQEIQQNKSDPKQTDLNQSKADAQEEESSYYDDEDDKKESNQAIKEENLPSNLDEYESEYDEEEEIDFEQKSEKKEESDSSESESSDSDSSLDSDSSSSLYKNETPEERLDRYKKKQEDSLKIQENPYTDVQIIREKHDSNQTIKFQKELIAEQKRRLLSNMNRASKHLPLHNKFRKNESMNEQAACRSISSVSSVSSFHSPSSPTFQKKLFQQGVINDEIILFEDKKQEMENHLNHIYLEKTMNKLMSTQNQLITSRVVNEDRIMQNIKDAANKEVKEIKNSRSTTPVETLDKDQNDPQLTPEQNELKNIAKQIEVEIEIGKEIIKKEQQLQEIVKEYENVFQGCEQKVQKQQVKIMKLYNGYKDNRLALLLKLQKKKGFIINFDQKRQKASKSDMISSTLNDNRKQTNEIEYKRAKVIQQKPNQDGVVKHIIVQEIVIPKSISKSENGKTRFTAKTQNQLNFKRNSHNVQRMQDRFDLIDDEQRRQSSNSQKNNIDRPFDDVQLKFGLIQEKKKSHDQNIFENKEKFKILRKSYNDDGTRNFKKKLQSIKDENSETERMETGKNSQREVINYYDQEIQQDQNLLIQQNSSSDLMDTKIIERSVTPLINPKKQENSDQQTQENISQVFSKNQIEITESGTFNLLKQIIQKEEVENQKMRQLLKTQEQTENKQINEQISIENQAKNSDLSTNNEQVQTDQQKSNSSSSSSQSSSSSSKSSNTSSKSTPIKNEEKLEQNIDFMKIEDSLKNNDQQQDKQEIVLSLTNIEPLNNHSLNKETQHLFKLRHDSFQEPSNESSVIYDDKHETASFKFHNYIKQQINQISSSTPASKSSSIHQNKTIFTEISNENISKQQLIDVQKSEDKEVNDDEIVSYFNRKVLVGDIVQEFNISDQKYEELNKDLNEENNYCLYFQNGPEEDQEILNDSQNQNMNFMDAQGNQNYLDSFIDNKEIVNQNNLINQNEQYLNVQNSDDFAQKNDLEQYFQQIKDFKDIENNENQQNLKEMMSTQDFIDFKNVKDKHVNKNLYYLKVINQKQKDGHQNRNYSKSVHPKQKRILLFDQIQKKKQSLLMKIQPIRISNKKMNIHLKDKILIHTSKVNEGALNNKSSLNMNSFSDNLSHKFQSIKFSQAKKLIESGSDSRSQKQNHGSVERNQTSSLENIQAQSLKALDSRFSNATTPFTNVNSLTDKNHFQTISSDKNINIASSSAGMHKFKSLNKIYSSNFNQKFCRISQNAKDEKQVYKKIKINQDIKNLDQIIQRKNHSNNKHDLKNGKVDQNKSYSPIIDQSTLLQNPQIIRKIQNVQNQKNMQCTIIIKKSSQKAKKNEAQKNVSQKNFAILNGIKKNNDYKIPIYFKDKQNLKNEMINQDAVFRNFNETEKQKKTPHLLSKRQSLLFIDNTDSQRFTIDTKEPSNKNQVQNNIKIKQLNEFTHLQEKKKEWRRIIKQLEKDPQKVMDIIPSPKTYNYVSKTSQGTLDQPRTGYLANKNDTLCIQNDYQLPLNPHFAKSQQGFYLNQTLNQSQLLIKQFAYLDRETNSQKLQKKNIMIQREKQSQTELKINQLKQQIRKDEYNSQEPSEKEKESSLLKRKGINDNYFIKLKQAGIQIKSSSSLQRIKPHVFQSEMVLHNELETKFRETLYPMQPKVPMAIDLYIKRPNSSANQYSITKIKNDISQYKLFDTLNNKISLKDSMARNFVFKRFQSRQKI